MPALPGREGWALQRAADAKSRDELVRELLVMLLLASVALCGALFAINSSRSELRRLGAAMVARMSKDK